MGIQEGELSGLAQRGSESPAIGARLTPEQQRENLARVNAALGVDDYTNPNMADTPGHLVEHGFSVGQPSARPA